MLHNCYPVGIACDVAAHFHFKLRLSIIGTVRRHSDCTLVTAVIFELQQYFMLLICFHSAVFFLNTYTIHTLQLSSMHSSQILLQRTPISNFTTCVRETVTSTLWTWQCVTITVTPCNLDTLTPPSLFLSNPVVSVSIPFFFLYIFCLQLLSSGYIYPVTRRNPITGNVQ